MSSKTWNTQCPTVPGWYWVKTKAAHTETAVVELFKYQGKLVVASGYGAHTALLDYATEWAGPIPQPAEPIKHPAFRYQLCGSYNPPKEHHWSWGDYWEFDRAKVEENAHRRLLADSHDIRMYVQERRNGRWVRRPTVEIRAIAETTTLRAFL